MRDAKFTTTTDQLGCSNKRNHYNVRLLMAARLLFGLLFCSAPLTALASADDAPPCKGALFQSPWDHQINANLLVKRGEACQIALRINNVKDVAIMRNPQRGKIEPVPETANFIYTPNNKITGRDRFIYRSTQLLNDNREITQTIIVEVEILSQSDYPYNFAVVDTGLPPAPPQPANDKVPPASGKPPPK